MNMDELRKVKMNTPVSTPSGSGVFVSIVMGEAIIRYKTKDYEEELVGERIRTNHNIVCRIPCEMVELL